MIKIYLLQLVSLGVNMGALLHFEDIGYFDLFFGADFYLLFFSLISNKLLKSSCMNKTKLSYFFGFYYLASVWPFFGYFRAWPFMINKLWTLVASLGR